jgi:hypothetical protein
MQGRGLWTLEQARELGETFAPGREQRSHRARQRARARKLRATRKVEHLAVGQRADAGVMRAGLE